MKHFIYTDNQTKETVFECDASGISKADEYYKIHTGKNIVAQPHVGCQMKSIEPT